MQKEYLTDHDAAQYLGISRNTLYLARKRGELPMPAQVLGRNLTSKAVLDVFLAEKSAQATARVRAGLAA